MKIIAFSNQYSVSAEGRFSLNKCVMLYDVINFWWGPVPKRRTVLQYSASE